MSTLAEFMILSAGDNRPPMLEKHLGDKVHLLLTPELQKVQLHRRSLHTAAYQVDDLDAYDSDSDDFSTTKEVFMANLSSNGSDVLFEVPHSENAHNDMLNQSVQDMPYYE
nr:hypothetical protein [Tanacetum cinerariifolium]